MPMARGDALSSALSPAMSAAHWLKAEGKSAQHLASLRGDDHGLALPDAELARDADGEWSFNDGEEDGARVFAETVLADDRVASPPACTLDVGRLSDGAWAVIEANPCWGAGLYGCDPKEVLLSIRDAIAFWRARASASFACSRWISCS